MVSSDWYKASITMESQMLALELIYCMMLLFILTQVGSKLCAKTATQQAEMLAG